MTSITTTPPVINGLPTVTPSPARTRPVVSTAKFLTWSGSSVGVIYSTFTLRPTPNSLTVFPTWSISTSPPLATLASTTPQPNRRAIAAGVSCTCVLLIVAVVVFILIRRRQPSRQRKGTSSGKWSDLEGKVNRGVLSDGSTISDSRDGTKGFSPEPTNEASNSEGEISPNGIPLQELFAGDKQSRVPDPFVDPPKSSNQGDHVLRSSFAHDTSLEIDVISKQESNLSPR